MVRLSSARSSLRSNSNRSSDSDGDGDGLKDQPVVEANVNLLPDFETYVYEAILTVWIDLQRIEQRKLMEESMKVVPVFESGAVVPVVLQQKMTSLKNRTKLMINRCTEHSTCLLELLDDDDAIVILKEPLRHAQAHRQPVSRHASPRNTSKKSLHPDDADDDHGADPVLLTTPLVISARYEYIVNLHITMCLRCLLWLLCLLSTVVCDVCLLWWCPVVRPPLHFLPQLATLLP